MKKVMETTGMFVGSKFRIRETRNASKSLDHTEQTSPQGGYQCPMRCEGNKVYDSPGRCPVCNMKLVPVGNGHHHSH